MQITLDPITSIARFTLHGLEQEIPFAQFGEFLLNDAPRSGIVPTWIPVGLNTWAGVTSAGLIRIRQILPPVIVDLPVQNYSRLGLLENEGDTDQETAWEELIDHGLIVSRPGLPGGDTPPALIRGIVPPRVWEIEYAPDGLIRQTLIFHGDSPTARQPWRLGNVNTDGSICWGSAPPTWSPTTTIPDIDFFFLTGSAFNTDWQSSEFTWTDPIKWKVERGIVIFGEVRGQDQNTGDLEPWTFDDGSVEGSDNGKESQMVEKTRGADDDSQT